jgi:hypothetical protein
MRGLDGKPGTPDKWPSPIAQWTSIVKKKVKIVPPGASVLEVVTDPQQDPFRNGDSIGVEEALARNSSKGVELVIKFKINGRITPPVSYHVYMLAGGVRLDYGGLVLGTGSARSGGYHSATTSKTFPALDPSLQTMELLLEPDEKPAEQFPSIETVWGGPYRIRNVKLQRFDAPATTTSAPATDR